MGKKTEEPEFVVKAVTVSVLYGGYILDAYDGDYVERRFGAANINDALRILGDLLAGEVK